MAEFENLIKDMNKQKEYKSELEIINEEKFDSIPWVNIPQLQSDISIS